jgi:hypothetical protein
MPAKDPKTDQNSPNSADESPETVVMAAIRRALHGLRFGQVVVIVQDGVVVQVDRTERTRLRPTRSSSSSSHQSCLD